MGRRPFLAAILVAATMAAYVLHADPQLESDSAKDDGAEELASQLKLAATFSASTSVRDDLPSLRILYSAEVEGCMLTLSVARIWGEEVCERVPLRNKERTVVNDLALVKSVTGTLNNGRGYIVFTPRATRHGIGERRDFVTGREILVNCAGETHAGEYWYPLNFFVPAERAAEIAYSIETYRQAT